jgi:hypothetical protein
LAEKNKFEFIMKQLLLIIATASLLFACDRTDNEQDILDTFFGDVTVETRPSSESYDGMQPTENVYFQDFNSAATSDWQTKSDANSTQGVENGELIIQGKQSFYTRMNFADPDRSEDFQMDIRVQFNFVAVSGAEKYLGIVFGVDDDKKVFNYIVLFNNEKHTLQIGDYNGAYNDLYSKPSNLTKNTHHLYTIRKAGTELYFFADKKFICKKSYEYFKPNYGFWLTANGIVSVDYVSVDYIE